MKALAAILVQQNTPLVLEEIEVPPPALGQVLVRVLVSGICGSQLGEIDGVKGPDRFLPHLLGHEGAGTVLECGEGVRTVKPGDRVVLHWRKGAGLESTTPVYQSQRGSVRAGWVTTFNELTIVSENRLTAIPGDFDPEAAALLGCAVTTGFGVVNNDARLKIGQSIAVFGAGGIGLSIVQAAAMVSAQPIIALDRYDNRLELARRLGATHSINSMQADAESAIRAIAGPAGVDVAVDNTGNVKVIETAYRVTAATGRTVLVGVPPKQSAAAIYTLPLHFEKTLTGSHGGRCRPELDIPNYVRLCQAGKLDLRPCLGRSYRLAEINQALEDMRSGALAGRAVLRITPEDYTRYGLT
jgi:S-(hydroxymethyl)glutathione dehydrogenase/alcohol dehydrogenase